MKPAAHLLAAIEILESFFKSSQPLRTLLQEWSKQNRYAGSFDRTIIGNIVHDALRHKNSIAFLMQDDSPRSLAIGTYTIIWGNSLNELINEIKTSKYSPHDLSDAEIQTSQNAIACYADTNSSFYNSPAWVQGNYQSWLHPYLVESFSDDNEIINQTKAMAARAPLDLRVNNRLISIDEAISEIAFYNPETTQQSKYCIRIPVDNSAKARPVPIETEALYQEGKIEIQDEGSQVAAIFVKPEDESLILDYCAGGGGKALALSSIYPSANIIAFDKDAHRLKNIYQRIQRSKSDNISVIHPRNQAELNGLKGKVDRLVLDVPCSGTGTWRRKVDSKWRLTEKNLEQRINEQNHILKSTADFIKNNGEIIYITCSLLKCERLDKERLNQVLGSNHNFKIIEEKILTPFENGCDGFSMQRIVKTT